MLLYEVGLNRKERKPRRIFIQEGLIEAIWEC